MDRVRQLTLNTKWISTVASIWIQCTSGSLYTFSIYSSTLKTTQHYDQSTLDTVSVFKDIGANSGILSGLLYTYATKDHHCPHQQQRRRWTRFLGPWVVHMTGAIQCFAGYFLMWAFRCGVDSKAAGSGHVLVYVIGGSCDDGFLGLSGAILIQVYQTIFKNNPTSYLLMLAILPTVNPLLLMWFVRIYDKNEGDVKNLNSYSLIALIVAAYLMVIIILENIFTLPGLVRFFVFVVLLFLLVSPLYFAIREQERDSGRISGTAFCEGEQITADPHQMDARKMIARQDPTGYQCLPSSLGEEMDTNDERASQWSENLNLLQAMCTVDFWILFLAMACGMGSGLATVNNISQIGGSLGYSGFETNSLVSLWSIWNFLGRFGAGYVSDYILHVRGWARPLFMVITLATMSIGHLVIASGLRGALYAGSILVGVCYGSQWSLMPTIASEIYGVGHLGTIFNTITIASPVGSYIFSVRVVGYIYDREASGEGNTCIGTHCFMLSFLIMASATLLGSLAALGLFFRTKRFYNEVILRRLLHSARE
ncbi:hypothetical protein Pint_15301 [Pistacia integerrima]|uniref:Uncharacterized protein n=1 Tax=Pistacia integerrima TaxID=434235 RepID=A0ACC0ZC83_9ROSI|nr:hypothetical protein Pint_15301 [Pistacia integerrima]